MALHAKLFVGEHTEGVSQIRFLFRPSFLLLGRTAFLDQLGERFHFGLPGRENILLSLPGLFLIFALFLWLCRLGIILLLSFFAGGLLVVLFCLFKPALDLGQLGLGIGQPSLVVLLNLLPHGLQLIDALFVV